MNNILIIGFAFIISNCLSYNIVIGKHQYSECYEFQFNELIWDILNSEKVLDTRKRINKDSTIPMVFKGEISAWKIEIINNPSFDMDYIVNKKTKKGLTERELVNIFILYSKWNRLPRSSTIKKKGALYMSEYEGVKRL